jgi:hypothetical protein
MVERPNWNFDNSGGEIAPATPRPEQVIHEVATQSQPSEATRRAFADDANTRTVVSTLVRDDKGRIIRPDWNQKVPVPAVSKDSSRPDWTDGKPRNETGQFVSKSEGELRSQWEREGGIAHVAQTVMTKETAMYSVAPSLESKVTEHLDRGFLTKAADHLRLGVSYGPTGFWDSVARFEASLSPAERDAWAKFCRALNEDEQAALIYGMSK